MQPTPTPWTLDDRRVRIAVAAIATFAVIGGILTRDDMVLTWSLLAPTAATFWLWAARDGLPTRWLMYLAGLSTPLVLNIVESNAEVSMFVSVLTIGLIAATEPVRRLVPYLNGSAVAATAILGASGAIVDFAWPNWLFGFGFTWGGGEVIHRFDKLVTELRASRTLAADQAAVEERRRIARDVHDLVGHSLTVVMLQVTGARHLIRKDPDEAERALSQAEEAARQSMADIRRTVGMLRNEADEDWRATPSADMSDVPDLVAEYVAAGLAVEVSVAGPIDAVDPATSVAGYRIVQEALTNASRHSVDATVDVGVRVNDGQCHVTVTNRGGTITPRSASPGYGLVSMRERVKSVGGTFLAGPTPRGWSVEATLPCTLERR